MAKKKSKSASILDLQHDVVWICEKCAHDNGGIWPKGYIGTFHNDICDVCNYWTNVTEISDWGYPACKRKEDLKLIISELRKQYIKMNNNRFEDQTEYIEALIHGYQLKLDEQNERR